MLINYFLGGFELLLNFYTFTVNVSESLALFMMVFEEMFKLSMLSIS